MAERHPENDFSQCFSITVFQLEKLHFILFSTFECVHHERKAHGKICYLLLNDEGGAGECVGVVPVIGELQHHDLIVGLIMRGIFFPLYTQSEQGKVNQEYFGSTSKDHC